MPHVDPVTGGFVVTHPTKRNAFEIITDLNRPYIDGHGDPVNVSLLNNCPTCNTIHQYKTYHIMLNGDGRAVVSPGVFQSLRNAKAFNDPAGLAVEAHTKTPPNQVLGTKGGMMGLVPSREAITIYHE